MQVEIDCRIVKLLKQKAENQGVELQQLLENFARGESSVGIKSLGAILGNINAWEDIDASCARMSSVCSGVKCGVCPFNSRGQLEATIEELNNC